MKEDSETTPVTGKTIPEAMEIFRRQKPPYECPVCHKLYRSLSGISYHVVKFDHDNPPDNFDPNTPAWISASNGRPTINNYTHNKAYLAGETTEESPSVKTKVRRQPLTYAEAQKMVEFDLSGEMTRTFIEDDLNVEIMSEQLDNVTPVPVAPTRTHSTPSRRGRLKFCKRKSSSFKKAGAHETPKVNLPLASYRVTSSVMDKEAVNRPTYYRFIEKSTEELDDQVEYDMDEEDYAWLSLMNEERKNENATSISQEVFELLMDRLEKESHFQTQTVNGDPCNYIDEDAVCCICDDGECSNSNSILFCDMCNLAVHQECYGVPYIPEGQWLCRRCLQSPSRPVECALCPSQNGAFKQTDDNRWAHVVCALWIPEVCFANTVFLEPIDSIQNIPPARWKLMCYICKKRQGACIQCFKTNCYTAFHVTCAQQAGLYMKLEPSKTETGQSSVRKASYCGMHTPRNSDHTPAASCDVSEAEDCESSNDCKSLVKKKHISTPSYSQSDKLGDMSRKSPDVLAKMPVVHIPFIPAHRLGKIVSRVAISKKAKFIQNLQSYWMLKRQSRNGVPLLRRLQASTNGIPRHYKEEVDTTDRAQVLKEQLKYWQQLRHDLERARLLVELIRKREKLKKEQYKVKRDIVDLRLQPLNVTLRQCLNMLQSKDTAEIFAEPVSLEEVPDYLEFIKTPMDFSTMSKKIKTHEYSSFDQFESDFVLMIDNCMSYNSDDTVFYRAAQRMLQVGKPILRATKKRLAVAGLNPQTGLHSEVAPAQTVLKFQEDTSEISSNLSLEDRLIDLEAILDSTSTIKVSATRASYQRALKKEIAKVKRQMRRKEKEEALALKAAIEADAKDEATEEEKASYDTAPSPDKSTVKENPMSPPLEIQKDPNDSQIKGIANVQPSALTNPSPGRSRRSGILFNKRKYRAESVPDDVDKCTKVLVTGEEDGNSLKIHLHLKEVGPVLDETTPTTNGDCTKNDLPSPVQINGICDVAKTSPIFEAPMKRNCAGRSFLNSSYDEIRKLESGETVTSPPQCTSPPPSPVIENGIEDSNAVLPQPTVNVEQPPSIPTENGNGHADFTNFSISRKRTYTGSSANSDSESVTTRKPHHGPGRRRGRKPSCKSVSVADELGVDVTDMKSNIYQVTNEDANNKLLKDPKKDPDKLFFLDLVWAKCRGYPSYPAMVIDPDMPRTGFVHNGVPIPVPPQEVLQGRGEDHEKYLVLFFDTRRTWQWLTRCKLEPLSADLRLDEAKLTEGRKTSMRKSVHQAYERAITHRHRVAHSNGSNSNHQDGQSDVSLDGSE